MESPTLFKWRYVDYHYIRDEPGESSYSPVFKLKGSEVKFQIVLAHENEEEGDHCPMWLQLSSLGNEESVDVKFRLWIENSAGTKFMEEPLELENSFIYEDQKDGDELFISHERLFSAELGFERNDSITFCCEILRIKPPRELSDLEFREQIYSLHEAGVTGDCILKVEDQDFKVPKNILMAGSDVFDRMFDSGTQESRTGVAKLEDVSVEIIQMFIKYLHLGGHLKELNQFAEDLFIFADRYVVRNLIDLCMNHMVNTFRAENIVRRLQIAFVYNNAELKNHALFYVSDYSSEGNVYNILKSASWMDLLREDPEVANEILIAFFDILKNM